MDGNNNSWSKPQTKSNVKVYISEDLLKDENNLEKKEKELFMGILKS